MYQQVSLCLSRLLYKLFGVQGGPFSVSAHFTWDISISWPVRVVRSNGVGLHDSLRREWPTSSLTIVISLYCRDTFSEEGQKIRDQFDSNKKITNVQVRIKGCEEDNMFCAPSKSNKRDENTILERRSFSFHRLCGHRLSS